MALKTLAQYGRGIKFTMAIVLAAMVAAGTERSQAAAPQPPPGASRFNPSALQEGQCLAFGTARSARDLRTGAVRFIGTEPGRPIPPPFGERAGATPESAARAYLSVCGSLFGLGDHSSELVLARAMTLADRRSAVRFQQVYHGIPIVGGELIVNLDEHKNLLATTARILAHPGVQTAPVVTAASASETALAAIAKVHGVAPEDLSATPPELSIYSPTLIGPGAGSPTLVWRTEITPHELLPIRELVLVDATRGSIALQFNQVETALQRQTYTAGNGTSLPGALVCDESNPTCAGGDSHAVPAHVYAGDTYNFYAVNHGRNSINNAGMIIKSTVRYQAGYVNAFWNGAQMVYGDGAGFPLADDVVGHELTHGVTQYTSSLFYYYQSGAINESFSDVWGEFIDQTNGRGNDAAGVKWLLGEDITGLGAIRNMKDPTAFGDPDRMTSALYSRSSNDNGGVHSNSGINNKAAYLMVDGGTFNGQTVTALGITKVAKIFYEVQTHLLTSGADYADLYQALYQGCSNLVGSAGIVASDCNEVRKATLAVEMNQQPVARFNTDAPLCPAGQAPVPVLFDNLEGGPANFTTVTTAGTNRWFFGSPYGPYAHSGTNFLYADDYPGAISDSSVLTTQNISLPTNAYLHFAHAYGFEPNRDGGVVEYSTDNGASWIDAGSLFGENGYTGLLATGSGNPLGVRSAFTADSHGYISSLVNLSSLAGRSVRFRWRMGLDSSVYNWGWWLDDVRVHQCPTVAPTISAIADQTTPKDVAKTISFTIADPDTPLTLLGLEGTSSNEALVRSISFGGAGAARTITLTPVADQVGTTTITIKVRDAVTDQSSSTSFVLTVIRVNNGPAISTIGPQPLNRDTVVGPLAFTVGDVDNPVGSLTVSGTSSNQTLIPNGNIVFGGSGAGRTVTLTPAAWQVGTTTITLTVSDGSLSATTSFLVASDLLISDTFTGANGTLLSTHVPDVDKPGAAWAITGSTPAPTLTSGMVGVTAGSGHQQATLNSGTADVIMSADYRVGSGPQLGALAFRLTDANDHLLLMANGNALQFLRRQNGAYTLLGSQAIAAAAAGSTHRIEVRTNGSTMQGWWDNALVLTAIDTFQQTATRHGLDWNSAYDATARYDNLLIRSTFGPVAAPGVPGTPSPSTAAVNVATTATLTWAAANATSYDVRFGTTNPPPSAATGRTSASYTPALSGTTTYFWQVVARNTGGATTGPVWSFTTAAAPVVVPADVIVSDTFTGANGALLSTHVPDVDKPGVPWTITGGTPAPTLINGAVGVTTGSGHLQAALNSGIADIIMGVDYRLGSGPQLGALAFRLTDANNHLLLMAYGNALQLYRKQNGVFTLLASQPISPVGAGSTHRMEVRTNGSTVQGWWDNALVISATETFQQTATRHGLGWNSAYDATITFDNFEIRSASGPVPAPGVPGTPSPSTGAVNVATTATLTWAAANATSYDVRFGTTNPPPAVATGRTSASYTPALSETTTYFWQVVARNTGGATTGPVWSFTTAAAPVVSADVIVSDTFTGANGALLSTHVPDVDKPGVPWTITGGTPAPTLINGVVGVTTGSGHLQAALNSGIADIIMRADYRVASGPKLGALAFRLTDANNHLLLMANGNALQLYRKQNGVYTLLASQPLPTVGAGSTHRIEVRTNGSTVQGWWDSALVVTATETFQQTATRHGLDWNSAYDATITFDNFEIRTASGPVAAPGVPGTPSPATGAVNVATTATLTWAAANATSYDVNFGTTNPPPAAATGRTSASYTPALSGTTTYFWQVVARNTGGATTGPVWSFTTAAAPVVSADVIVSDTFTGANGTLLSTHVPDVDKPGVPWTITGGTPAPALTNGAVGVTTGSGHVQAALNSGIADIIMGADYRVGSGPQLGALAFRLTDANNHLLLMAYGNALQLYRRQNGVYTLLANQPIPPVAAGSTHRLEVRAIGSTLQGRWDGALVVQVTEAFQQTATRHGLDWNSAYDATATYDNFEIRGTLAASFTVSPTPCPVAPAGVGTNQLSCTFDGSGLTGVGINSYVLRLGSVTGPILGSGTNAIVTNPTVPCGQGGVSGTGDVPADVFLTITSLSGSSTTSSSVTFRRNAAC